MEYCFFLASGFIKQAMGPVLTASRGSTLFLLVAPGISPRLVTNSG